MNVRISILPDNKCYLLSECLEGGFGTLCFSTKHSNIVEFYWYTNANAII